MASRNKGSVPNVKRALREGDAGRAQRKANINAARKGTVGSALNDSTAKAFRGTRRRNS